MPISNEAALSGKVVSPIKLAHVVFQTPNFKAMVAFYKTFLGAHASHEDERLAFLSYDEEHHRVAFINTPGLGPREASAAGVNHVAFTFASLGDLSQAYQQRRARGIEPVWCVNHGPTTSMYYRDPDGNSLETQVDNFDTVEDEVAYMTGPGFAENPIGVDFDPEELVRRLESGEDEAAIKKRPDVGPRGVESINNL
jgi:catechol-2,3-dioxygenase